MSWNGDEPTNTAVGPWGGKHGIPWDDGVYFSVRQVVISSSAAGIVSIQFEYEKNNYSIWCDKHGGDSYVKTDKVKLDCPTEFLISMGGSYGSATDSGLVIVKSLYFESNWRRYGPFGIEQGKPFSLPVTGGKLVGFHGRSSSYLDAIGVYAKPLLQRKNPLQFQKTPRSGIPFPPNLFMDTSASVNHNHYTGQQASPAAVTALPHSSKRVVSYGPWGGEGGTVFDDGIYTGVREIRITRTKYLVSILVCYDQNGRTLWGDKHGGSGGLKVENIVFDYPFEVLTHISGYYASMILRGPTIIRSITFHTNKRSYGPFGDPSGFAFSSGSRGVIVGFHGSNGYFVDSIGVHVLESAPLLSHPSRPEVWGIPKEPALFESGPWGGGGGKPWDDGVYRGVRKIVLTRSEAICSIQVKYDWNGQPMWSPLHGTANDACTYQIKFEYPYEVLTCISGYYDILVGEWNIRVIRSLTFHTNRAQYGPYGKTIGTYFSSAVKDGKVVGFHGRSGRYLDAIGVHMQYWVSDEISHRPPHRFMF